MVLTTYSAMLPQACFWRRSSCHSSFSRWRISAVRIVQPCPRGMGGEGRMSDPGQCQAGRNLDRMDRGIPGRSLLEQGQPWRNGGCAGQVSIAVCMGMLVCKGLLTSSLGLVEPDQLTHNLYYDNSNVAIPLFEFLGSAATFPFQRSPSTLHLGALCASFIPSGVDGPGAFPSGSLYAGPIEGFIAPHP